MSALSALVRERRLHHGLTQAQLALRAGTTQAALSRLEAGGLSPTAATVDRLLFAMGEGLDVAARRLDHDADPAHLQAQRLRSPAERLELAMSWNRLAGEVAAAGAAARR